MPDIRHDIVVIGASAGGLQALTEIVKDLPRNLRACVLVAVHAPSTGSGVLPEILARSTTLHVGFGNSGDPLTPGRIYVARPDCHMVVTLDGLRVVHGPRENGFRPAIDPLFRTAARELGARVIGVVLSGALGDGTYGLSVIKHYGGIAIVQDPADAIIPAMPRNAIRDVDVDHVLPARDIGATIAHLTALDGTPEGETEMSRPKNDLEPQLRARETEVSEMQARFGPPSGLTCPDCGGALWEVQEGGVLRYQCHVGHQYAPESLVEGQREAVDSALWSAVRVLEEHASLKTRMAARAEAGGLMAVAQGFAQGARDAHEQAESIRAVLLDGGNGSAADTARVGSAAGAGRTPRRRRQAAASRRNTSVSRRTARR